MKIIKIFQDLTLFIPLLAHLFCISISHWDIFCFRTNSWTNFWKISSCLFLIYNYFSEVKKISYIELYNSSKKLFKKYKSFPPKFHKVLQRFSTDLIFYFTAFSFGGATVGILSVAEKILAKPLNIISESFK